MSSNAEDLRCDNAPECLERVTAQSSYEATVARARARGWHIFDGETYGGEQVYWILCASCIGAHARAPRAPQVLDGQVELF